MDKQDAEWQDQRISPHGLVDIPLSVWGRLDRGSDWSGFAAQASTPAVAAAVADFGPDVVLVVDWHGAHAWEGLQAAQALAASPSSVAAKAARASTRRSIYSNFRVDCTSVGLSASDDDLAFFRAKERAAMLAAGCTVALCRSDAGSSSSRRRTGSCASQALVDRRGSPCSFPR